MSKLDKALQDFTILIDTREQNTRHITEYYDKNNINYRSQKLDYGDYSFCIDDKSYADKVVIERKGCLEELANNLTKGRERFERELQRAQDARAKLILLIEDATYADIIQHRYRSEFTPKAFMASLMAFQERYRIDVQFMPDQYVAAYIHKRFYYYMRNLIIERGNVDVSRG